MEKDEDESALAAAGGAAGVADALDDALAEDDEPRFELLLLGVKKPMRLVCQVVGG